MHWVDRGEEPSGLEDIRRQFTQEWIERYHRGTGNWPSPKWGDFRDDLSRVFYGLCGYCEEVAKGEVDHFKPASKFPSLVYEWSNWIFACHSCNQIKSNKWPVRGYIDPCKSDQSERPESFFDFDAASKRLKPRAGISSENHDKADQMIKDLCLNGSYRIRQREERAFFIESRLVGLEEESEEELEFSERITSRDFSLSSFTRKILEERDIYIED